ncbi:uncharacterized protein EV154DRAFT_458354 [Mucor mucedo]|uniref:uncharacterized protein n=1 Tax=Mucor mucedo TaxID=29922 RepID=UPI00221FC72F|nr:uncharacterized protein EV154DRAFT_458354 [Mucor mucedo]KAI7895277.1 hypothetical protein EV154DRAFT_458354 [Mucor mucedo]
MRFLLFMLALVLSVFVQAEIITKESPLPHQLIVNTVQNYKQRTINYLSSVQALADNAERELKANKNIRPSTEYSIHDITFTFAKYLPSWVYPEILWKEDTVTRRKHIAKVLRSSPLISRPRYTAIRDEVAGWAQTSGDALTDHFANLTLELDSLLTSTMDLVETSTDAELMDSLFMTAGCVTLERAINKFIIDCNQQFGATLDQVNSDFDRIVTLSGELRIPLESIRLDAIERTKYIHDKMFNADIANRLRNLGRYIQTHLQNLSRDIKNNQDNQELSKAFRKYTADHLLRIQDVERVYDLLKKSKTFVDRIWNNAKNELIQSPFKINYWIDVVDEVKEAAKELVRHLLKSKKRHHQKHRHCSFYN